MTYAEIIEALASLDDTQLNALASRVARERDHRLQSTGIDGSLTDEELTMLEERNLLGCVRSIRNRTGLGLSESKAYMDRARFHRGCTGRADLHHRNH